VIGFDPCGPVLAFRQNVAEVPANITFLNHAELGPANSRGFVLVNSPCEFRVSYQKRVSNAPRESAGHCVVIGRQNSPLATRS
jgi:hypothetical protein